MSGTNGILQPVFSSNGMDNFKTIFESLHKAWDSFIEILSGTSGFDIGSIVSNPTFVSVVILIVAVLVVKSVLQEVVHVMIAICIVIACVWLLNYTGLLPEIVNIISSFLSQVSKQ